MALEAGLWIESFDEEDVPAYPCPWCDRGNLRYVPESLRIEMPEATRTAERMGDLLPTDSVSRFNLFLRCAVSRCGQVVSMHGDAQLEGRSNAKQSTYPYGYMLTPKGAYPPPPLASLPPETPEQVSAELQIAFSLFWVDFGSCANRLRIAVERTLDEFGLPPGNLGKRIEAFERADPGHAATFNALRHVGNVGSHEGQVSRQMILDAFVLFQDAVAELFGRRSEKIKLLRQRIIDSKGH